MQLALPNARATLREKKTLFEYNTIRRKDINFFFLLMFLIVASKDVALILTMFA